MFINNTCVIIYTILSLIDEPNTRHNTWQLFFSINEFTTVVKLNYIYSLAYFITFFFKECHVRLTTRVVVAVRHVYSFTIGGTLEPKS